MSDPIALYIHWPFCVAKCPYCDFNSHAAGEIDQGVWRDALVSDMEHWAGLTAGRRVTSVFFGGGTPSLMAPDTVATLLEKANDLWGLESGVEITLEANPSSVEVGRFQDLRSAGVNRISIGVQALNDADLRFLGRVHTQAAAREAVATAARVFDRYSFDLIYARPDQTVDQWRNELTDALAMAGDHLSLYQLTIEPGTAFFRDRIEGANEDTAVALFEETQILMDRAGLGAYEISNHARPGCESRHNLTYWRGGEYVGVGPGAHGRVIQQGRWQATHQIATPDRWLSAVQGAGHGTAKVTPLNDTERAEERIMTGLRLAEGLNADAVDGVRSVIDMKAVRLLTEEGVLDDADGGLRVTAAGRLRLNAIVSMLLG